MLGLDRALEEFRREFQSRIAGPQSREADRQGLKPKAAADSPASGAPTGYLPSSDNPAKGSADGLIEGAFPASPGDAVDSSIDSIWHDDDSRLGRPIPSLRKAPLRVVTRGPGCADGDAGVTGFSAALGRLTRSGQDELVEASFPLLAATMLTGWTALARPRLARSSFTSNFSRFAQRGRLARTSRAGKT